MAASTIRLLKHHPLLLALPLLVIMGVGLFLFQRPTGERLPAFPYGELRIGVDASYPPFAVSAPDGTLTGLDIELGNAIALHLNVPIRFVNMGIDGLYDSLKADQVDILISALTVDDWRLHDVRYTRPYFNAGLVLVSDANQHIESMPDLPGKSLAFEFGGLADAESRIWARRVAAFTTQPYELPAYALDAVRMGEADAALVDAVSLRLYLREHPEWLPVQHYITRRSMVIAVQFFRGTTFDAVDGALKDLLQNGTIDSILRKWL